jgi:hypothetical protein
MHVAITYVDGTMQNARCKVQGPALRRSRRSTMKQSSVTFIANCCTAPRRRGQWQDKVGQTLRQLRRLVANTVYSWPSTNAKYKREATSCTDHDLGPGQGASGEARAAGWEQRRWPEDKPVEEHEANIRTLVQHKPIWASRTVTWCAQGRNLHRIKTRENICFMLLVLLFFWY